VLLYIRPSFPRFISPQQPFAEKGGDPRVMYFLVNLRVHLETERDLRLGVRLLAGVRDWPDCLDLLLLLPRLGDLFMGYGQLKYTELKFYLRRRPPIEVARTGLNILSNASFISSPFVRFLSANVCRGPYSSP
jgi:hypothetical protein